MFSNIVWRVSQAFLGLSESAILYAQMTRHPLYKHGSACPRGDKASKELGHWTKCCGLSGNSTSIGNPLGSQLDSSQLLSWGSLQHESHTLTFKSPVYKCKCKCWSLLLGIQTSLASFLCPENSKNMPSLTFSPK